MWVRAAAVIVAWAGLHFGEVGLMPATALKMIEGSPRGGKRSVHEEPCRRYLCIRMSYSRECSALCALLLHVCVARWQIDFHPDGCFFLR